MRVRCFHLVAHRIRWIISTNEKHFQVNEELVCQTDVIFNDKFAIEVEFLDLEISPTEV